MAQKKSTSSRSKKSGRKRSGAKSKSRRLASTEVRTEMHHMRSGKHKIKSRKQAIAIGLSKARKKGAHIPKKGKPRRKKSS